MKEKLLKGMFGGKAGYGLYLAIEAEKGQEISIRPIRRQRPSRPSGGSRSSNYGIWNSQ